MKYSREWIKQILIWLTPLSAKLFCLWYENQFNRIFDTQQFLLVWIRNSRTIPKAWWCEMLENGFSESASMKNFRINVYFGWNQKQMGHTLQHNTFAHWLPPKTNVAFSSGTFSNCSVHSSWVSSCAFIRFVL